MSIKFSEIFPHEMIQVLVSVDDIEELQYAKVLSNEGDKLFVSYLSPSSKIYKGACIYSFEPRVEIVECDAISEHYDGVIDVSELGIIKIDDCNHFVIESEIEDLELESDIEDMSDTDSSGESEDSFIAEEDPDLWELPDDHTQVDEAWASWTPSTVGESHFKRTVDKLETYAKLHFDNLQMEQK
jgi:hypothetical protein